MRANLERRPASMEPVDTELVYKSADGTELAVLVVRQPLRQEKTRLTTLGVSQ